MVERRTSRKGRREAAIYIGLELEPDLDLEDGDVRQAGWGRSNKKTTGLATLARTSRRNRLPTFCALVGPALSGSRLVAVD